MPSKTVAKTSAENVAKNNSQFTRAINSAWRMAPKASMYSMKVINKDSGKESIKYTHLINKNAYQIAVSGACAAASGALEGDMNMLGMQILPDSKSRPWSCAMSPAAAFMLEQHLASIAQQIVYNNRIIRSGLKKHTKNHRDVTKFSIEEVRRAIFQPATGVPSTTTVLPMILSRKKKVDEKEAPGDTEAPDHSNEPEDDDEGEGRESGENGEEEEEEEEEA